MHRLGFSRRRYISAACLQVFDLKVARGELVALVGPVGSGKSSLLSALLNEMSRVSGSVGAKIGPLQGKRNIHWARRK